MDEILNKRGTNLQGLNCPFLSKGDKMQFDSEFKASIVL